ncbi:hypothetical protein [Enhydrobacter sp.]|jgi:hypothetical protein|uniref:hypothetical protein n=1 Tax=Enhydrobacter sp. TaxID=1894999 RepID=UPI00262E1195|nr:hypothetical protein [Enhydrobacter sp.]WIM09917.1 MAG: hypothetical protein OJF58_000870 [Enhydrobacter sp.]
MSKADDKPMQPPGSQEADERSNIVPLVPKPRKKAADRAADRPAGDGEGDDPGPSAA